MDAPVERRFGRQTGSVRVRKERLEPQPQGADGQGRQEGAGPQAGECRTLDDRARHCTGSRVHGWLTSLVSFELFV